MCKFLQFCLEMVVTFGLFLTADHCLAEQGEVRTSSSIAPESLYDGRRLDVPLFLPNSDVPSATIRRLVFDEGTENDLTFYSAGDDKVVRKWRVKQIEGQFTLHPGEESEKIRWPLLRNEPTGFISALSIRRYGDVTLLAFGGYGLYPNRQEVRIQRETENSNLIESHSLIDPAAVNYEVFGTDFHPTEPILAACLGQEKSVRIALWRWSVDASIPNLTQAIPLMMPQSNLSQAQRIVFSPNGQQLSIADLLGNVEVWEFDAAAAKVGRRLSVSKVSGELLDVAWTSDKTWLAATTRQGVVEGDATTGKVRQPPGFVRIRNSTNRQIRYRFQVENLNAVAGQWSNEFSMLPGRDYPFPTTKQLGFYLKDLDMAFQSLPEGTEYEIRSVGSTDLQFLQVSDVKSLAISPDRQFFAFGAFDSKQAMNYGKKPANILLRSTTKTIASHLERSDFYGSISAIAFSSNSQYLIAAGTDEIDAKTGDSGVVIRLWSVASGKLLDQFPSRDTLKKAFTSTSISRIAYAKSRPGTGVTSAIHFSRGPCSPDMNRKRVGSATVPSNQSVTYSLQIGSPSRLSIVPGKQVPFDDLRWEFNDKYVYWYGEGKPQAGPFPRSMANTSVKQFGSPVCAAKFRSPKGEFIAIGYEHGVLIWDAKKVAAGAAIDSNPQVVDNAICRGMVGHDGITTSLAVDAPNDAKLLVSASEDGTICGWSLDDLETNALNRNELGVTFELSHSPAKLTVKTVDKVVPGFTAGFRAGQEVINLNRPKRSAGPLPSDWKSAFATAVPGELLITTIKSVAEAQTFQLKTSALWEPMWTLYPLIDGENWAVWSPEGYFYATEACAKAVGWQMNHPFKFKFADPAEANWNKYRLELPFNRLLKDHNRRDFLYEIRNNEPPSEQFAARVRIEKLSSAATESLSFRVTAAKVGSEEITKLQVWCNSRLVKELPGDESDWKFGTETAVKVDVPWSYLRKKDNVITAVVESDVNGKKIYKNATFLDLPTPESSVPPRLHYLGIGVTTLKAQAEWKKKQNIEPLKYAANDVVRLAMVLGNMAHSEDTFSFGKFELLIDSQSLAQAYPGWSKADKDHLSTIVFGDRSEKRDLFASESIKPPVHDNIIAALNRITDERTTRPDDLVVIHLTGHGFVRQNEAKTPGKDYEEFYFVGQDADADFRRALTRTELDHYLNRLSCRCLLLIDTCHSGFMSPSEDAREAPRLGPQIITSCQSDQVSFEDAEAGASCGIDNCGLGLFTAVLVRALTESNPTLRSGAFDGFLNVEELGKYVKTRVPDLLKRVHPDKPGDRQSPVVLPSVTFGADKFRLKVTRTVQ
jgi:WD40 repeat protein